MDSLTLTIKDDTAVLKPTDFADFIYLFRAVNLALWDVVPPAKRKSTELPNANELAEYRTSISRCSPEQLNRYFANRREDVFEIESISRNSPMEMTIAGVAFLLATGALISGGSISVSFTGVKAVLPPLGKGVKHLREALGLGKTVQAGFGVKDVTIKLNSREYTLLMQQDPASEADGGFQHFLVGLQFRVNKTTKELELSERDLEKIYRYMKNRRKGGWQSRFNKIFGRHFSQMANQHPELTF